MADKKIVRQEVTRRSKQEKLNEALAKKPTASFINSRGIDSTNVPEGKKRLIQRQHIRNGKNNTRFARPVKAEPTFDHKPFQPPGHKFIDTPDWFGPPTSPVDVSIIVPCFKSQEYIRDQIQSWDLSDDLAVEVIYVDDSCPGKSHDIIVKEWASRKDELKKPLGRIVLHTKNSGFAAACNTGASFANGKYLLFLNADTTVTKGWLKPMVDAFQDTSIGLVGNMQLKPDGSVDSCGSEWSWQHSAFLHVGKHIHNKKLLDRPYRPETLPADLLVARDVEMVTGACMMMPKTLFTELGGFDSEYRIGYWEDTDLNMKVHSHGYRVRFVPDSRIYHKGGHANAAGHPYSHDNRNLFHKRWVDTRVIEGYLNGIRPQNKAFTVNKDNGVVYTAVTNGYDMLKPQPKNVVKDMDFVAFLDREKDATDPDFWTVRTAHSEFTDHNRNAKIHKVMPHLFFPDKEYSLWIDGSVRIVFPYDLERLARVYLSDCDLAVFKHPDRSCIYQEANACLSRKLDNADTINKQVQRYTQLGYPSNNGLAECSVLLRRHTPEMQRFNEMWWEEIKNGSKRDQISFNYVAHKLGFKFRYFPGDLRRANYLFKREVHKKRR